MANIIYEYLGKISLRNRKDFLPFTWDSSILEDFVLLVPSSFYFIMAFRRSYYQTKVMRMRSEQNDKMKCLEKKKVDSEYIDEMNFLLILVEKLRKNYSHPCGFLNIMTLYWALTEDAKWTKVFLSSWSLQSSVGRWTANRHIRWVQELISVTEWCNRNWSWKADFRHSGQKRFLWR